MDVNISFEVCSACQFTCDHCAHEGLMALDRHYNMSMDELETFIRATEESGYQATLHMHGPGEPLLWKHLTEGLTRLRASPAIAGIYINSNGRALPKLLHILDLVDKVKISLYPNSKTEIVDHPKVIYNPHEYFLVKQFPAAVPCTCLCQGPMVYKDLVFTECGPPLFDALIRMNSGRHPLALGRKLARGYADAPKRPGIYEECAYCWANSNCETGVETHVLRRDKGEPA